MKEIKEEEPFSKKEESSDKYDSSSDDVVVENNFIMRTRTAGTLAFAPPERITDNCLYS